MTRQDACGRSAPDVTRLTYLGALCVGATHSEMGAMSEPLAPALLRAFQLS